MKFSTKIARLIAIVLFALFCISYFFYNIHISNISKKELYENYPPLSAITELNNQVISNYTKEDDGLRHSPGITFVTLDNNKNFRIWATTGPYTSEGINEIIQAGDTIFKKSNNDSIYIFKGNKNVKYLYLLIKE